MTRDAWRITADTIVAGVSTVTLESALSVDVACCSGRFATHLVVDSAG